MDECGKIGRIKMMFFVSNLQEINVCIHKIYQFIKTWRVVRYIDSEVLLFLVEKSS